MSEMKNSGIEWVGLIPKNWRIKKGKYFIKYIERPSRIEDEIVTCFRDGEVTLRTNRREDGFTISEKEIGYQGINIGDLVVHGMDGFAGAIGISDSNGKASPVLNVLEPDGDKRFFMYYLRTMAYGDVFLSLSTGIRVRTCDTNWKKLRELPYVIPPLETQKRIGKFLDIQCNKIDELISDIKEQIETLDEYKKSIITEAVTRGLNPDVETKNSGIEWAPNIPKTWNVKPIKYIMNEQTVRTRTGEEEPLSVTQAKGIIKSSEATIANPTNSYEGWRIVKKGDIVFNKYKAHSGVFFESLYDGIVTFNYSVYRCFDSCCAKYFEYQFKTRGCIGEFNMKMKGVGDSISPLYTTDLFRIKVLCPPLEEQEEIIGYLNKRCLEIDNAIAGKQEQLDILDQYKKSLIYEYTTGKKQLTGENDEF